jgi:hypothetical protein
MGIIQVIFFLIPAFLVPPLSLAAENPGSTRSKPGPQRRLDASLGQ